MDATILDRLRGHNLRVMGPSQWSARCPAHDDRRASLSVAAGDNGGVVLHCHVGCSPQAVCAALGLTLADLMPRNGNSRHVGNGQQPAAAAVKTGPESSAPPANGKMPPEAARVITLYCRKYKLGKPSAAWGYADVAGRPVGIVVRWETIDGKVIRPFSIRDGRWVCRAMEPPRPLYRLRHLQGENTLWVAEGEKAAEVLRSLGLAATASAGGAKAAAKTDWSPVGGKTLVVWPDLDPAGDAYAAEVARLALAAGALGVLVLAPRKLPRGGELPVGGDAADWVAMHNGADPAEMRRIVEEVAGATAKVYEPGSVVEAPRKEPVPAFVAVAPGTIVLARDRGNYGTVVEDRGETCLVHFRSPDGNEADVELAKSQLAMADGRPLAASEEPPRFLQRLVSSPQLVDEPAEVRYLVQDAVTIGEPGTVGGPAKCLKTLVNTDLALSVASGTKWLNHFQVVKPGPVAFLSGESGRAVLRRAALRIAASKGVDLRELPITWGFSLPQLTYADHVAALGDWIAAGQFVLVILDPAYLCLLNAANAGQAGNLFAMGAALSPLSEIVGQTGATVLLLHHYRKNRLDKGDEPADLQDLAMAGMMEWSRFWCLLDRREPYANDGLHKLWLRLGGSAGHAGLYGVEVNERGEPDGDGWETRVERMADVRDEVRRARDDRRAADLERREAEHVEQAVVALRQFPQGETTRAIRAAARLNTDKTTRALLTLEKNGRIEACEIQKGKVSYAGFRLKT